MAEIVRVGTIGEIVIPEKLCRKYSIKTGTVLEIKETKEGLLLKLFNPVADMKGVGKGIFGDPIKYQKRLREE